MNGLLIPVFRIITYKAAVQMMSVSVQSNQTDEHGTEKKGRQEPAQIQ